MATSRCELRNVFSKFNIFIECAKSLTPFFTTLAMWILWLCHTRGSSMALMVVV